MTTHHRYPVEIELTKHWDDYGTMFSEKEARTFSDFMNFVQKDKNHTFAVPLPEGSGHEGSWVVRTTLTDPAGPLYVCIKPHSNS